MSAAKAAGTRAVAGLVTGAIVWGLIWYPYRVLAQAGVSGVLATTVTYLVAIVCLLPLLPRSRADLKPSWLLLWIALSAGACNMGYVLAMLSAEVMRVLLLFYLAPLWTVLLSRLLLGERLNAVGVAVIGLALAGALVMLWQPQLGLPIPGSGGEWIAVAAGFFFALTNVLARKARVLGIEAKSMAVFCGVVAVGAVLLLADGQEAALAVRADRLWLVAALVVLIGLVLFSVNFAVLHGLAHTPANRAIVIFLFELVVAALAAWYLADEAMGLREWTGGAMIIAAGLFSGRLAAQDG